MAGARAAQFVGGREKAMRRREFILSLGSASTIWIVLGGAAVAQFLPGMTLKTDKPAPTAEEKEKQKNIDDAYRSAIQKLPDQRKTTDPWGGVRTTTTNPPKKRQQ